VNGFFVEIRLRTLKRTSIKYNQTVINLTLTKKFPPLLALRLIQNQVFTKLRVFGVFYVSIVGVLTQSKQSKQRGEIMGEKKETLKCQRVRY